MGSGNLGIEIIEAKKITLVPYRMLAYSKLKKISRYNPLELTDYEHTFVIN